MDLMQYSASVATDVSAHPHSLVRSFAIGLCDHETLRDFTANIVARDHMGECAGYSETTLTTYGITRFVHFKPCTIFANLSLYFITFSECFRVQYKSGRIKRPLQYSPRNEANETNRHFE
ncbi:hypothetical protein DPMN_073380 [Dreissena polymorpha]|uniref:Uncharacterized protein n=1 Tax=Dreissena polymorpha TaxID=45954 RepID=A0A9D4BZ08_DREPO|nr:hypothetical protein DPMN_073380 [Dreissena polymorpha]